MDFMFVFWRQGGKGIAKIGIITAATDSPHENFLYYQNVFVTKYGALSTTWIPVFANDTTNKFDPSVAAVVTKQTGFFFGGGDPYRISQRYAH